MRITELHRVAVLVTIAAGCGATARSTATEDSGWSCPAGHPAIVVGDSARPKLGRHLVLALERRELCGHQPQYLVVEGEHDLTEVEQRTLDHLGSRARAPVRLDSPSGPVDVLHVRPLANGTASAVWLVAISSDAVGFLAMLPWVKQLSIPSGYPVLSLIDPELSHRIGAGSELDAGRSNPPYSIELTGWVDGCLDDARRAEVAGIGVFVGPVFEHPDCPTAAPTTIVSFGVPIGAIADLAALPWISRLRARDLAEKTFTTQR